jgi:hypothetical protein
MHRQLVMLHAHSLALTHNAKRCVLADAAQHQCKYQIGLSILLRYDTSPRSMPHCFEQLHNQAPLLVNKGGETFLSVPSNSILMPTSLMNPMDLVLRRF